MTRAKSKLLLGVALAAITVTLSPTAARAQASADRTISLAIPAQRLSDALRQLAEASGLQLVYDAKITDGKASPGVSGSTTGKAALAQLLAGSGLTSQFSGDRTVIITAGADAGVRAVGVVSVQGTTGNMPYGEMASPVNGTNGSRDVEATEGTGSYTTGATSIVSKIPQTLRETPQSVSVMTLQQIQDQNLISVRDILERLPGLTAINGPSGEEFRIYSRGFQIHTFTFDGGAPVSYAYGNRPVIDMSEFDSVQLVRGADGLFGGYGDPGGVVNLVRKKPLDHQQIIYNQDIGSFNYYREEADIAGPLTSNGKLRGRFVVARQDNKYFYDVANSHKTSVYGVLEYDLQPSTLLTVGASYYNEKNLPNQGGLPRYLDGSAIDFPIATCLCPAFDYDRAKKTEVYGVLAHKFNDNLSFKLNATYNYSEVDALYYGITSSVVKGGGNVGNLGGYASNNPTKQVALEATFTGAIDFLNRHNQFVIGGNYIDYNGDGSSTTTYNNIMVPDIFHFNPYAYPAPAYQPPFLINLRSRGYQFGVYANTRLELFKSLHLLLGIRYSGSSQSSTSLYSFSPTPQIAPTISASNLSRPAIGATYDLLRYFTVFGNHMSIYKPQTATLYTPGNPPTPPITGSNNEGGLKYQSSNKRFNASVAYYSIVQNGFLQTDYSNSGTNKTLIQDTRSRGVDVEATGEVFSGLQISASYTYNNNTTTSTSFGALVSPPATSYAPKNKVKTWFTYRPSKSGPLARFIIGGGVDVQSSAYTTGQICAAPIVVATGNCPYHGASTYVPYAFATPGYATVSGKLGYQLTPNIELSVVGKNLTNVKAYSPAVYSSIGGYNFYIQPLDIMGSIRFKW